MSLRLICGRAGTGKSEYCLKEIIEKRKQNKKIYIITPEQFSYAEEKKLLQIIPSDAIAQVEVLTFDRMAYRVASKARRYYKKTAIKSRKSNDYSSPSF